MARLAQAHQVLEAVRSTVPLGRSMVRLRCDDNEAMSLALLAQWFTR